MYRPRLLLFSLLLTLLPGALLAQERSEPTDGERAMALQAYIDGIHHFEQEEYEIALDQLMMAHLTLGDEPGILFALADVYYANGDLVNAAYYGQRAVELERDNKWFHLKLAEIYRRAGRNQATIDAYKEALEVFPNDLDILLRLAQTQINYGRLLEANDVYDRVLELRGGDFDIHLRKFRNFNALGMREEALAELQQMRQLDPGNLATLRTISQFYLELDEVEMALEVLNDARERNARDPQTLLLLAEVYVQQSNWQNLGSVFVSMLEDPLIYPSQKMELVRYVYLQQQRDPGNEELADQLAGVLNAFSENEPDFAPAQLLAAEFFLQENRVEEAIGKLKAINRLNPELAEAWQQRMQALFTLERYEEVTAIADSANSYAPDDAFIQFFAGAAHMLSDRYEEARTWLENATLAPANRGFRSVIHGTLGDVLQQLDNWQDASSAYEMAMRLDPNNHTAMNNYAYFMSVREENLEYALELAEQAVAMEPDNAAYLDTIGWVYYKKNEYNLALQYIQRSIDTGDAGAEVYEHLGDVYFALQENEKAIEWWNKALENDSEREYLIQRIESAQS
ncbi:MAG: tetratricopeptide repeat protein [Balneolaceae bacterium]